MIFLFPLYSPCILLVFFAVVFPGEHRWLHWKYGKDCKEIVLSPVSADQANTPSDSFVARKRAAGSIEAVAGKRSLGGGLKGGRGAAIPVTAMRAKEVFVSDLSIEEVAEKARALIDSVRCNNTQFTLARSITLTCTAHTCTTHICTTHTWHLDFSHCAVASVK